MHVQEDIQLGASSPLMLALHALLILIPDPGSDETFSEDERQSRASVSQTLFQRALEALELTSQTQITGVGLLSVSNFHPHVPRESETPLACCVLGLYQYLHPGDLQEMTALSWRAFDISTSLCLDGKAETSGRFAESLRRTWWMSVSRRQPSNTRELPLRTQPTVLVHLQCHNRELQGIVAPDPDR